jgi:hypothetical protein
MLFDITSQLLFGARAHAWMGFLVLTHPDGTIIAFLNATDESSGTNLAWVRLDADGEHPLETESASGSAEAFILHKVVESIVGQNTLLKEAPKRAGLS